MTDLIAGLIPDVWGYVATALGAFVALVVAFIAGRRRGAVRAENKALRANDKANERITASEAEMDRIDSDAERVRRLREYSDKHGV
jgi:uncharacterized membrane protein YdjX (TVP38/TMEM64 family)